MVWPFLQRDRALPAETVAGAVGAKAMLLGGAPIGRPRHMSGRNFASSTFERINAGPAPIGGRVMNAKGAGRSGVHSIAR